MPLEHEELTGKIIGAAIEVHRQLGPGFIESIYENALVYELHKRGLNVDQQLEVPIIYDGTIEVGKHRLDLLIDNHGAPIAEPVWALLGRFIARHGARPTLIERDRDIPQFAELDAERHRAAELMAAVGKELVHA